MDAIE